MANNAAISNGDYETIFVRDRYITEASHSNIFFVKNDVVYTHPANSNILNGITRIIVIDLCKQLGIEVVERVVSYHDLPAIDEAFLTGTVTQIAPISQIDDYRYNTDDKNAVTRKIQQAFAALKNTH